ncbi:methylated-DNA-protein-cysteine methyltransferase [Geomicrobium sp. JCM 19037]|uniref:methylated-DNA--[protein]-cysteine S-methyltransferase n=1 Tax=unclassified Geomicrobium TaxID=2628951 RepID=UPI00045F4BDD|nr:methylated-DNA--[protein]-cysteine S-methyltransferase [Geomicrobium sp. JCM 19037]GAK04490.1 methylated-DNA-protein-cysteine methyltransferase [Geomicrobium sp. JCM 19037]
MNVYYTNITVSKNSHCDLLISEYGLCYVGAPADSYSTTKAWLDRNLPDAVLTTDPLATEPYENALQHYLLQKTNTIDISIHLVGTPFQKQVWNELCQISYGQTKSYSDVARALHRPTSVRAVSNAIAKNPVMIAVPCHRVIGKNGKLTGFRGGLAMKKQLLQLEEGVFT